MKRKKIKFIMLASIVVMIITVILSYNIEARSQKLPAVVRSNKVVISTEVSGTIQQYMVSSMQKVEKGEIIATLENPRLAIKLSTLQQEKQKYEDIIASSRNGDHLDMELFKLQEDIQKNGAELTKLELDYNSTLEKLEIYSQKFELSRKGYNAQKKLYKDQLITMQEFEKETNDHLTILSKYNGIKNDSLLTLKEISAEKNIIKLLEAQKEILKNNVFVLASKYLIDLDKVEAEINDLKQDIANLIITSPIKGVVTDIRNRPGEKVKNGDVIAEISEMENIWLIGYGNAYSSQKIKVGNSVVVYCGNGEKIAGAVASVSPVMEKVKALSSSFETVNTYAKIEIIFYDQLLAKENMTPGERLFVRVNLK